MVPWQISHAPSLWLMQRQQENIFRMVLWVPALSWWFLCRPMDLYSAPKPHLELVREQQTRGEGANSPSKERGEKQIREMGVQRTVEAM